MRLELRTNHLKAKGIDVMSRAVGQFSIFCAKKNACRTTVNNHLRFSFFQKCSYLQQELSTYQKQSRVVLSCSLTTGADNPGRDFLIHVLLRSRILLGRDHVHNRTLHGRDPRRTLKKKEDFNRLCNAKSLKCLRHGVSILNVLYLIV